MLYGIVVSVTINLDSLSAVIGMGILTIHESFFGRCFMIAYSIIWHKPLTVAWATLRGLLIFALAVGLSVAPGQAADEVNVDDAAVAVEGYDVVAYFEGSAVAGDESISTTYEGAIYWFASTEHRDRFVADPARYVPAFGGFCSYGVRTGRKMDIDPQAYQISDGRLFLMLNHGTQVVWEENLETNKRIAETILNEIRSAPITDLTW